jgi:hypothetical protein
MTLATATGLRRTIRRVKRICAELDYANRRMLEIRTGIPFTEPHERVRPASSVEELEALYHHSN